MTHPNTPSRIEAMVDHETKQKYREHAKKTYGMKVGTWLKMLAHRDFTSHGADE